MSRLFNVEVFNQTMSSSAGSPYVSSPEYNSLLGSADVLMVMVMVDMVQSTGVEIDVAWQISNLNEEVTFGTMRSIKVPPAGTIGPSDVPFATGFSLSIFEEDSGLSKSVIGAFGRFSVTCSGAIAKIRIVVAGYGS